MGFPDERDRLIVWLPVAFAAGIALYFAQSSEPERWVGPLCLAGTLIAGWALRRFDAAFLAALALAVMAAGFTLAVERTSALNHPVLKRALAIAPIEGRIVDVEPSASGQRVTLDRIKLRLPPWRAGEIPPERIRLSVPETPPLHPGMQIKLKAGLSPPSPPSVPGTYDFARAAWFMELGALGFTIGTPEILGDAPDEGWRDSLDHGVTRIRLVLTARIAEAIESAGMDRATGAISAALVTGEMGPIPTPVMEAYRDSGLAHILSISGLHMTLVAGLVFVGLRAVLAAIPPIALNADIKKVTAGAALVVIFAYLILAGSPVPTQRSFVMSSVLLIAVLLDREALSLRSVGWAAVAVLALHPEALIGASFQMSFAAVYALIALYETMGPRLSAWRRARSGWWSVPLLYVVGVSMTTLAAGSATALYAIYHFNRYAVYALLANLLAIPVVGFWVMPAALLAVCLMPFGLDDWGWIVMGYGVAVVGWIADWVAGLPGAVLSLPAMPMEALIVITLGGLWLILWRRRWRLFGLIGMAAGMVWWSVSTTPDILIDGTGRLVAVKREDGVLSFSDRVAARSARLTWARRNGQGETSPKWSEDGADAPACDSFGCVHRVKGRILAVLERGEALAGDCSKADLVIARVFTDGACRSGLIIDRGSLWRGGGHAIRIGADGAAVETVSGYQGNRPWNAFPRTGPRLAQTEEKESLNSDASAPQDDPEP